MVSFSLRSPARIFSKVTSDDLLSTFPWDFSIFLHPIVALDIDLSCLSFSSKEDATANAALASCNSYRSIIKSLEQAYNIFLGVYTTQHKIGLKIIMTPYLLVFSCQCSWIWVLFRNSHLTDAPFFQWLWWTWKRRMKKFWGHNIFLIGMVLIDICIIMWFLWCIRMIDIILVDFIWWSDKVNFSFEVYILET